MPWAARRCRPSTRDSGHIPTAGVCSPKGRTSLRYLVTATLWPLCREGSFGRAYLDFTGRYRFDAAAFEEGHDLEGMAQRLGWDDDLLYVITRGLQLHDLWHTLGGYGPDWAGEAGVMAFTYGQIPDVGIGVIAGILRAIPGGNSRRTWKTYLALARARGRRANNLLVVPYEQLLAQPIEQVRDQLGIAAIEVAHPQGIPHSTFRYGFAKAMETAYEPYSGTASDGTAA